MKNASGTKSATLDGDTGNAFCWQLLAGLDFDITPHFGVGISYKYLATKPTVDNVNVDYKASIVTLDLTYTF